MISIQPKWCELIASGKKTVEVRKTRPKIDVPFKCYIYCTQGKEILAISKYNDKSAFLWKKTDVDKYNADMVRNGKVIGEFVCDSITEFYPTMELKQLNSLHFQMCDKSCVNMAVLYNYANGKMLYGWHISDLVIYDEPKELSEFYRHDNTYDNAFGYVFEDRNKQIPLSRPPQSWCYVEGDEGE